MGCVRTLLPCFRFASSVKKITQNLDVLLSVYCGARRTKTSINIRFFWALRLSADRSTYLQDTRSFIFSRIHSSFAVTLILKPAHLQMPSFRRRFMLLSTFKFQSSLKRSILPLSDIAVIDWFLVG